MTEYPIDGAEAIAQAESFMQRLPLNGTLVDLGKEVNGHPLSLMVRNITYPFAEMRNRDSLDREKSYLLVNVFGREGTDLVNAGFLDWEISNRVATCEHQQSNIQPRNSVQDTAYLDSLSFNEHGFLVREGFRGKGIGDFMIALSLKTLKQLGVESVHPGHYVLDDALPRWRGFGINTTSYPRHPFPLAATHPKVNTSIAALL